MAIASTTSDKVADVRAASERAQAVLAEANAAARAAAESADARLADGNRGAARASRAAGRSRGGGLYKLNPVYPQLDSAWFDQPPLRQ